MEILLSVLNSESVKYAIVLGIIWALKKLFAKEPKVKLFYDDYKGAMIKAIKFAEAEIPDDTENKHLRRLDLALKYTVELINTAEERKLSKTKINPAKLTADISAVHHEVIDENK